MQLIRYQRPELSLPSRGFESLFRRPLWEGRNFPSLFDWDSLWADYLPAERLPADLYEDEEAYYARLEVPGVKKKDVKVELENAVLTVSFERRSGEGEETESVETMSRSLSVPDGIKGDKVSAKLKDGILTITMPKPEASKPRKIDIH